MSRSICEGDRIKVVWIEGYDMHGVVLSMPCAVGDLLFLEDDKGVQHGINTNCVNLEMITREATDAKDE